MTTTSAPQTRPVLLAVFLAYLGQMILNPVIAPLARSMGLREWHIGTTISLAAVALVLLSQFWGRRAMRLGVKRVLLLAMGIAFLALTGFAVVAYLGTKALLSGTGLVLAVMATRGLLYGGAIAAVAPSTQQHLVTHCSTEEERVKAVGALGATQGFAAIIGSILGGVLAAVGGLMCPILVMPAMMLLGMVVLALRFHPQAETTLVPSPAKISWRDERVLPFLLAGFALFLCFASVQTVLGFAVQDRFHLSSSTAAGTTAALLVPMSVFMVLTQALLLPRLGWSSRRLLRIGFCVMAIGLCCLIPRSSMLLLATGCILLGIGSGLAIPGYTAGPTMAMTHEEQGGLAGLLNANNGLTFAIAPVASTTLYGINPNIPYVGATVLMLTALAFSLIHPALRREVAPPALGEQDDECTQSSTPREETR